MDIIRDTTEVVTIRGWVPATDPFETSNTTIQLSTKACALQPECTATTTALNVPKCNLYSVDMTFSGSDGLVTDKLRPAKTRNLVSKLLHHACALRCIRLWGNTPLCCNLQEQRLAGPGMLCAGVGAVLPSHC